MAQLSLTPRETSSGLRPPRLAQQRSIEADGSRLTKGPGKPAARAPSDASDGLFGLPSIPTREGLKISTRELRDRRLQKVDDGAIIESLSAAIRQRTQLTLAQAHAQPGSADVNMAREQELQRQRARLEELRRVYDLLHAEFVEKQKISRVMEVNIKTDKHLQERLRAEAPADAVATSPIAAHVYAPLKGSAVDLEPSPLEQVTERVRFASEELIEMLHSCEVRTHTAIRTTPRLHHAHHTPRSRVAPPLFSGPRLHGGAEDDGEPQVWRRDRGAAPHLCQAR